MNEDIKARIDALTETEAKAALYCIVDTIQDLSPCIFEDGANCPYFYGACDEAGVRKSCAEIWLEEALKEARK